MGKTMTEQVLEGFQEKAGQSCLIGLMNVEHVLRRLEGLIPLGMADFSEDETGSGGSGETNFDGHGRRSLEGISPGETTNLTFS